MALTVGVEVGAPADSSAVVLGAVVDEQGRVLARSTRPLPDGRGADAVAAVVAELVAELVAGHEVAGVGVARADRLFAAGLERSDELLRDGVAALTGLPVVVESVADATAWAEHRSGAGRGAAHLVVLTLGAGLVGGIVVDGRLYRGRPGGGAGLGHMQVVDDGRRCGCGRRGCWERYCSGRALVHQARELAEVQPHRGARLLALGDGRLDGIDVPQVTRAAQEGDPAARACVAEVGGWLGTGLADLAAVLDPELFVVGGGVADAGDLLLDPARRSFAEHLTGGGFRPHAAIRQAQLGSDAAVVGAAGLVRAASLE